MARDVIISAFATPSQRNLNAAKLKDWVPSEVQPLGAFNARPLLLTADKASDPATGAPAPDWGGQGFHWAADRFARAGGGSILKGMLAQKAPDVQPRRICIVAFSAGNSFLNRVLSSPDAALVDSVLSLDGMTFSKGGSGQFVPSSFDGYLKFAERATGLLQQQSGRSNPYISPMFVNARTHIVSNSPAASSTAEAAEKLFWLVNERYWQVAKQVPSAVKADQGRRQQEIISRLHRSLDSVTPVTVDCNGARTYSRLRPNLGYLGNLWSLDFGGKVGADHCMIAYVAQKALFDAFLVPRWNSRNEAIAGLGGLGAEPVTVVGEGANWTTPTAASPGGGIVRRDVLSASSLAVAGKYAAGAAAAYLAFELGRMLTRKIP